MIAKNFHVQRLSVTTRLGTWRGCFASEPTRKFPKSSYVKGELHFLVCLVTVGKLITVVSNNAFALLAVRVLYILNCN